MSRRRIITISVLCLSVLCVLGVLVIPKASIFAESSDENVVSSPDYHDSKLSETFDLAQPETSSIPTESSGPMQPETTDGTTEPFGFFESSDPYDLTQLDNIDGEAVPSEESVSQEEDNSSVAVSGPREYWFESSYYGPSQAVVDQDCMVEWVDNWFVVHWYTEYGRQIQELRPGDIVHINGRTVKIYGSFDISYDDDTVEGVRGVVGYDKVLFQTCYGSNQPTMLVQYGYYI